MKPGRVENNEKSPGVCTIGPAYSVPRLRTDMWNRLRDTARRLRRVPRKSEEHDRLHAYCAEALSLLDSVEPYHSFPGKLVLSQLHSHFDKGIYEAFARQMVRLVRLLSAQSYRRLDLAASGLSDYADLLDVSKLVDSVHEKLAHEHRPYFEVLVVEDLTPAEEQELRTRIRALRRADDEFIYELVFVSTFEDALIAAMVNPDIETCVVRNTFDFPAAHNPMPLSGLYTLLQVDREKVQSQMPTERTLRLGRYLKALRPELDLFLFTDAPVEDVAGRPSDAFNRVFYLQEDYLDLHLSILKGIHSRFETPFFEALRRYSQKPTGMFHALPISRGRTIARSHWIKDMGQFYGNNIFLAETSATTGGLDSLLQPTGSLKRAQEEAARAFGSRKTFFVTNGTSTANKIVMQALIHPDDIVLLAHDCHKSHPYALILAGARPVYLDAYPLTPFSMYGGVPLRDIKQHLIGLRREDKLDRVRLLLLTNITFDGITYDPYQVMMEILAIKPDIVFVWDEAWFAYGRFSPTLRRRTAMDCTKRLYDLFASKAYQREYAEWKAVFDALDPEDDATWLDRTLLADPARARLRVYATQSTHKTLTALRQGSMIHVHDHDFETRVENSFHEAYMTHTSTSPNYQILASLDVGRRQMELEGYELVQRSIELAMTLRERVARDPVLQKHFRILGPRDMVPEEFRPSGMDTYVDPNGSGNMVERACMSDEFMLDPTRITLHVGKTGMNGDQFKKLLMDQHDIHINKTSRNTVLFMIHIGMTRGTIAHLVKVLTRIARELDDHLLHRSGVQQKHHAALVHSLTEELPPLPNFSRFHEAFTDGDRNALEGDIRRAFFLAYKDEVCDFLKLDGSLREVVASGRRVVSAGFVTPYPPGFPVLVPGQIISLGIVDYLRALDVTEIHGYEPEHGLRVFRESALQAPVTKPVPTAGPQPPKTKEKTKEKLGA